MNLFGSSSDIVVITLPPAPSLLWGRGAYASGCGGWILFFFVVDEHKVHPYGKTDFFFGFGG